MTVRKNILSLLFSLGLMCSWINLANATESYEYTKVAIESLYKISTATNNVKPASDPSTGLSEVMKSYIKAREEMKEASYFLPSYKESKDSSISSSSDIMIGACKIFDENLDLAISNIEHILNNPKVIVEKQGTTKKDIYQLQANFEKAWSFLGKAATMVALAMEDQNRLVDGKTHYLKITSEERKQLKLLLLKDFGAEVKDYDHSTNVVFPASVLWTFLDNKKWVSADEK